MFAQASATLPNASGAVVAALTDPGRKWMLALNGTGRQHLHRVGVRLGQVPVYKQVRLRVGAHSDDDRKDSVMLPVSWEVAGGPAIFPRMEGTLHVEPEGPTLTRLTLNATYDPPFGDLGRLADRVVMHRLAQMTMSDFVARLGHELEAELGKGI